MMGPLEHLMRNAVSHGIEDGGGREAQGKPAEGVISLSVAREGPDIIMSLADDGAGLDKAKIRAKAVERG
jgi:chemotaxis protein histidine kinase CheA